jgi:hypothetical protein
MLCTALGNGHQPIAAAKRKKMRPSQLNEAGVKPMGFQAQSAIKSSLSRQYFISTVDKEEEKECKKKATYQLTARIFCQSSRNGYIQTQTSLSAK